MSTPPDSTNGRVTLAVLGSKLDTMIEQQKSMIEKQDLLEAVLYEHSVRLEGLHGEMGRECQRLDGRIDRTDDKVRGWQVAQGGLTVIATSLAAWLGIKL